MQWYPWIKRLLWGGLYLFYELEVEDRRSRRVEIYEGEVIGTIMKRENLLIERTRRTMNYI